MKKYLRASGLVGTALLAAITAAGCSAETGNGTEAAVGSTAQAITNGQSVYFGGTLKLDSSILNASGNADNIELHVGGYDRSGTAQTVIGFYDRQADTFNSILDAANHANTLALPVALGEPEVKEIPGTSSSTVRYYLIVNGRGTRDGQSARQTISGTVYGYSYVLKLNLSASKIVDGTITEVTGARLPVPITLAYNSLKPCGTGSRLIAFGGMKDKGFYTMGNTIDTTDQIQVFTFNSGNNGGNSTWGYLQDTSTPSNTVSLQTTRGYAEVLDWLDASEGAHHRFYIGGGENGSADALKSTEKLLVNDACQATNADSTFHFLPFVGDMPAERTRMASFPVKTDSFTVSNHTRDYEWVLATGSDTSDVRPTSVYLFDTTDEVWISNGTIQEGKIFGRFMRQPGASNVTLTQGLKTDGLTPVVNKYYNTSTTVDLFTDNSGASHSWSNGTALSVGRLGAAEDALKNGAGAYANYLGFGATHTNTTGLTPNPTTMQTTFDAF